MPQKRWPILLLTFSLGLALGLLPHCGGEGGPKVKVYISHPDQNGMAFYDEKTTETGFVDYKLTDKFICLHPDEAQTVMEYFTTRVKKLEK